MFGRKRRKPEYRKLTEKNFLNWRKPIDLKPMDWDPLPGLSRALEKEGWPGAIRLIRKGKVRIE